MRIALRIAITAVAVFLGAVLSSSAGAQENYEIQVYPYETVERGHTMVELHSNFTFHGSNDWFETGFYIFTSLQKGQGWDFVGSHIRPRVRIPPKWHWPVGVSLSNEIGWQSRRYSADTWTWEMRPIIDKQLGRWYLSFNPTLDRSF